jgi:hypothetical protein
MFYNYSIDYFSLFWIKNCVYDFVSYALFFVGGAPQYFSALEIVRGCSRYLFLLLNQYPPQLTRELEIKYAP